MGSDYFAVTQEPLGRTLKSEFPEVNNYVTMSSWKDVVININDKQNFEDNILYATAPNLFQIFSFEFIKGDPKNVLSQPNTVVLSENIARKFFGTENPVGKIITVRGNEIWIVTGIYKSMPANSQFAKYGIITSFETYALTIKNREKQFQWGNSSWFTYLLLKNGTDPNSLQNKIPSIIEKYLIGSQGNIRQREFYIQPLKDIHLYSKVNFEMGENGDIKIILVLIAIALIILSIACINYTNLSTARASLRAREVGVRKVIGAKKLQLIYQFIGESIILSITAGVFALVLDELFIPSFYRLIGIDLGSTAVFHPSFLLGLLILTLIIGLLSGAYPAFILSKYQPASVLKGDKIKGDRSSFRRILVIIQFTASIALIACTFVILTQMNYIKTKDMGYNRENVIVLPLNDASVAKQLESMKNELNRNPAIIGITASSSLPININSSTIIHLPGENDKDGTQSYQIYTDYDFIKTFDIKITEGRDFSRLITTDSSNAVLINQSFAKSFGLKSAIGNAIKIGDNKYNVIGVIKDFNMHSLHHEVLPLFIGLFNPFKQFLCIRTQSKDLPATLSFIKSVWNRYDKLRPFKYTFLDSDFDSLYKAEDRLTQIVTYSSFLAIFISCLGLFGLVSFIVEQRRKEIGIRKVLGASVSNVVGDLSKQFLLLVLLANIIAFPAAYYFMNKWLQDFAYRINMNWWVFVLSGAIAFLIALLSVSFQVIKAAVANPIEALRYE